jgi:hypothetical protein
MHLGWTEWEKPPDLANPITHSICSSCMNKVKQELEDNQTETINEKELQK